MPVSAPPRQPGSSDVVERDRFEALIEEAKQRARRRRWTYAGAAVMAVAAVAATVALGGPGSSHRERSVPDAPVGAPADVSDDAATLVASWGEIHRGWALVYADGRVIWYPDMHGYVPKGTRRYSILERHLTPAGLDLVRSGDIERSALLRVNLVPPEAWADSEFRPYAPAEYAACHWERDATSVLGELPAAAQALLRGTQQTYSPIFAAPEMAPSDPRPIECFALTPEEAGAVVGISDHPKLPYRRTDVVLSFTSADGTVTMMLHHVMPHGELVAWGG